MTTLLEIREWMKQIYGQFSLYIKAGIRFVTGMVVFMMITYRMGYMVQLKTPVVPLMLALVCTFLPVNLMAVLAMVLLVAHLYSLSLEIALVMLVLFVILYLVYYRFAPKYAFVLVLMPVLFVMKIPYVMPIALGLVATPVTAVPLIFGTVVYYLLHYIAQYGANVAAATTSENVQKYAYVFSNAMKDPGMYLFIVTMTAALVLVYCIRRRSIDNAWRIAITTGAVGQLLIVLIGNFALDISIGVAGLIIGTLVSVLVGFALHFFIFNVDYTRTEYVQFEDDEYYYYVKAVPKVTISKREKTVKRINTQRRVRPEGAKKELKPEEIL